MNAAQLAHLPLPQKDRLKHIELRIRFLGEVRRTDLMQRFAIQSAAASRDLALYKELAPHNIDYDNKGKRYLLGGQFSPLFSLPASQVLSWMAEQVGDSTSPDHEPLLPCVMLPRLAHPDLDVLAGVTRAIHFKHAISIRYNSISSGQSRREIVPFALLDTGLRWHVRAFDRKTCEFRDFVLTRIHDPVACTDGAAQRHEQPDQDMQWTRIVELELVPHPDRPRPDITQTDYNMSGGKLTLKIRAALAGYALRKWSVDCTPNHSLQGPEYRLWLKDHLALYGAETAVLAPGYTHQQERAV